MVIVVSDEDSEQEGAGLEGEKGEEEKEKG